MKIYVGGYLALFMFFGLIMVATTIMGLVSLIKGGFKFVSAGKYNKFLREFDSILSPWQQYLARDQIYSFGFDKVVSKVL